MIFYVTILKFKNQYPHWCINSHFASLTQVFFIFEIKIIQTALKLSNIQINVPFIVNTSVGYRKGLKPNFWNLNNKITYQPCFLNPLLSVWISDETLFLLLDILHVLQKLQHLHVSLISHNSTLQLYFM